MDSYHKHNISDKIWHLIKSHLTGMKDKVGRPAGDNRLFINAVFYILRTDSSWIKSP